MKRDARYIFRSFTRVGQYIEFWRLVRGDVRETPRCRCNFTLSKKMMLNIHGATSNS